MSIYNIKPRLDESAEGGGSTPSPVFIKVEGKLYLVRELPEIGEVANLYKLLDGTFWSWYHNETKVIDPVELSKGYDLIYSNISKDNLKEFLESVRQEILHLHSEGIPMDAKDFGNYELFTEHQTGTYRFAIPVSVFIEDKLYTLNATCYLRHYVVDGELADCPDETSKNNASINIKIEDFEDADILFDFYYNFMNPLSPEYVDVEDQKWLLVDNDTVIVSEEQLDILEFTLSSEWVNNIKETYNYDVDYPSLNFMLDGGYHIVVDEGYTQLGEDASAGKSLDFNSATGKLSLLDEKGNVISEVDLGISTALVSAVYDENANTLTLTDIQGNEIVVPLGSGGSSSFKVNSLSELTPEFIEEHLQELLDAMFLEDKSRSRVYTKVTGNTEPGTKFPFKLPGLFSINLVFAQPNVIRGGYNYILINKVTGEVTIKEGE